MLSDHPDTGDDAAVARASLLAGAALQRGRRGRTRRRIVGGMVFLAVASGVTGYWAETEGPLHCSSSSGRVQGQIDALVGWMLPDGEIGTAERSSCGEAWESGLGGD